MIPRVLSIAGVDPSGGAGLLADIKAMSALGAYACGAVAAMTAQNTLGVAAVEPVRAAFLEQQLEAVFSDVQIDAVKVGMLANATLVRTVAQALRRFRPPAVVVDPVMVATSGDVLLDPAALDALRSELLPLATLVTPNLPEAACLLGDGPVVQAEAMEPVARRLFERCAGPAILLKGGHLAGTDSDDCLFDGTRLTWFKATRVATRNTHGTGCTLSSAIAALLPQCASLPEAIERAKLYLTGALEAADGLHVGHGHGPVDHFWLFRQPK